MQVYPGFQTETFGMFIRGVCTRSPIDGTELLPVIVKGLFPGVTESITLSDLGTFMGTLPGNQGPQGIPGPVSSVGITGPALILSWSGSPVTDSGTITASLIAQAANLILAGPTSGSPATPTFRALKVDDIPTEFALVSYVNSAVSSIVADETTLHLSASTFSIKSTYVGQTSITTLGTVSTGVWNGTVIAPAFGGTGLATLTAHAVVLGEGTGNVSFATVGTAGRLLIDQGASADPSFNVMSGDATISSSGTITVTKTSGVSFGTLATQNGTFSGTSSGTNTGDQTNITGTAGNLSGTPTLPNGTAAATQAASDNSTKLATTAYADAAVATAVTGTLKFKGATDCSTNPNYPAASKGDVYVVSVAGKIGGASGVAVDVGDQFLAIADNAGGTQAAVGTSWTTLEHNLQGALLSANNLSDVASVSSARTNLGGTTIGQSVFTLTNPSAITFPRFNADNTVSALSAAAFLSAIGGGTGSGTVTAIGVTTANGVSGSSSGGSTPNLTITLAAITPSTVNGNTITTGTGTLTLSTFTLTVAGTSSVNGTFSGTSSGTNTGDQTIPTLDAVPLAVANVSFNSHKATNVTDPTNPQDAATKNYVDLATQALAAKSDCQSATTVALAAATYNNGSAGVGATLTLTVAAVLIVDGYTPVLNDRILIKNQADPVQNGIYYLSTVGVAGITNAVLTRSMDFDDPVEGINGALVYVLSGTANANTLWSCTTNASITFGTTNINWTKFLGSTYTADETTLHLSGTTFSIISTYVGQTSVVTLGTVTTGTWQATKVGLAYGGTNADLSGTGAANNFLKQSSAGAAVTVGSIGIADLAVVTPPAITRVTSTASSATPTPNADTTDTYILTALAAGATFGAPTGSPSSEQKLSIRIKDNGSAQTLAFNAIYRAGTIALPTTTIVSKTMRLGFIFNSTDTKWDFVGYIDNLA